MPAEKAVALLAGLVDDVGRWGEHATTEQWDDAYAVLDSARERRRHWIGRSKGYSKTRDVAGMSLSALLTQFPAGSSGYVAASDQGQAGLIRKSIEGFVAHTPGLAAEVRVDQGRVTARSGAEIVILAADSAGSHGLRPFWLVIDELANWPDAERHRSFFDSLWAGLPKVAGSRGIIITTAGSPAHFSRPVFETAGSDPLWRLSDLHGPAPWVREDELEAERRRMAPSTFARWWLNEWAAPEDSIADPEDVAAACVLEGPLAPVDGCSYVATVDLGVRNDRTAVVVAHADRSDDGVVVTVDRLQVWTPSRGRPVSVDEVRAWLAEFCRLYGAPLLYDPSQAYLMVEQLRGAGVSCSEFVFSASSVGMLASSLMQALRARRVLLPDDEELRQELLAVKMRETSPGVLRLDHSGSGHDDRVVAVAMAVHHLTTFVARRGPRMRVSRSLRRGGVAVVGETVG